MKKLKKLVLKKEVVARISHDEMITLKGGTYYGYNYTDAICYNVTYWNTCKATCLNTCTYPDTKHVHTQPPRCCQFGCCETIGCQYTC